MVEQVPFILKLDDGMVRGPADDRGKNGAFKRKRSKRAAADSIHQLMRRACRVGQVVIAVIFVNPWSFKISPLLVTGSNRITLLVDDRNLLQLVCKREHILA
ncbi:hypothetical protein D3C80_1882260 [compost metagenome]